MTVLVVWARTNEGKTSDRCTWLNVDDIYAKTAQEFGVLRGGISVASY